MRGPLEHVRKDGGDNLLGLPRRILLLLRVLVRIALFGHRTHQDPNNDDKTITNQHSIKIRQSREVVLSENDHPGLKVLLGEEEGRNAQLQHHN